MIELVQGTTGAASAAPATIDGLLESLQGVPDEEQDWRLLRFQVRNRAARLSDDAVDELIFAAALPHWFDAEVLSALLGVAMEQARNRDLVLRQLGVVEPSPAVPTASSLHDASRELVVRRLVREHPQRFAQLAERAHRHFRSRRDQDRALRAGLGEAPAGLRAKLQAHARALELETVYFHLAHDPESGWAQLEGLARRYLRDLDYGALNALIAIGEEARELFPPEARRSAVLEGVAALADLSGTAERWFDRGQSSVPMLLAQEVESFRDAAPIETAVPLARAAPTANDLPTAVAEHVESARQALLDGEPRTAVTRLDTILEGVAAGDTELDPSARAELLALRGHAHLAAHDYASADRDFGLVLRINDRRVSPWLKRSEARRLRGAYRAALDDATRAVRLSPKNPLALSVRGEAYLAMGHLKAALHDFDAALETAGSAQVRARALGARGETLRRLARFAEAVECYDGAIALRGETPWLLAGKGETYRQWAYAECQRHERQGRDRDLRLLDGCMRHYWTAIEQLGRAVELDPTDAWARASRGECYRQIAEQTQGRGDGADPEGSRDAETYAAHAMADLSAAIELRPDYTWARLRRGDLHKKAGRLSDALADFETICARGPENALWLAGRGDVYRLAGDYELALADLDKAALLDGGNAWIVARRGFVHRWLGRYREAIDDYQRALSIEDRPWVRLFHPEAVLLWTRFEPALDPERRRAALDRASEGLDGLRAELPDTPGSSSPLEIRLLQGRIEEARGFPETAFEHLRAPAAPDPDQLAPNAKALGLEYQRLFVLARVGLALDRPEEAARCLADARARWARSVPRHRRDAPVRAAWGPLIDYGLDPDGALEGLAHLAAQARTGGERTAAREALFEARLFEELAHRDAGRLAALDSLMGTLAPPAS